jgi:hypothetical protein
MQEKRSQEERCEERNREITKVGLAERCQYAMSAEARKAKNKMVAQVKKQEIARS